MARERFGKEDWRQRSTTSRHAALLAAALIAALATAVFAQDDAGSDDAATEPDIAIDEPEVQLPAKGSFDQWRYAPEEMVVTAQKREQDVQEVPISMTVLNADFVLDTGLTSFDSISQYAPNVSINAVTDVRSTAIRIRGIGSDQTNAGIDASVGVFIDGIYQGRTGLAAGAGLLDIERIEILRGPQGTLFGKNTAAGAFNITTNKPDFDGFGGMLETLYGDYNQREVRGWFNLPLWEDRVATRLSGYATRRDAFDENLSGTDRNDGDTNGFRSHTKFLLTDELDVLLSADYGTNQDNCCAADIATYTGPPSLDVTFDPFPPSGPLPVGSLSESTGRPLPSPVDPFDRVVDANTDTINSTNFWGVTLDLNYDLNDYGIRWLSAHRRFGSLSQLDGDFSGYDAVLLRTDEDFLQWSSELQLISPSGEDLEYVLGAFFYHQDDETAGRLAVLPEWIAASPSIGPALERSAVDGEAFNLDTNKHQTWSYALFGQATYYFTERWSGTVGLRGTHERKTRDGSQIATLKELDVPPFGPDQFYDEVREVWDVSPLAVLNFAATEDASFFGKFARGFKSGGFNQQRVSVGAPTSFDDEQATDFELGVRTTWLDRMVTANATGFYTIFDDFQAQAFDGSALTVTNAGSLTSYGIEADFFLVPHETTTIGGSVGWNVAEYDDFVNSPCTADQTFAARPSFSCAQDLSGRRLDNAPRWTTSTFAQYEHEIGELERFDLFLLGTFRIEYNYRDFLYLAQDLDPNLTQSPIHLLNLRLSVAPDDGGWEVILWSQNTLDERYGVVGIDVPITSGFAIINAPPRTFGATARIFF